jgi:pimeloyl-ACP methyl ester carboxylesterase
MNRVLPLVLALLLLFPASVVASPKENAFVTCADAAEIPALSSSLCVKIAVPLDHARPGRGEIELFVRKFPAVGRVRGQLWLVAGGPGESGASFYPLLASLRDAAPGYDLLIPDHRGTGYSTRLCPVEESRESAGGTALEGAEWGSCFLALAAGLERTRAFNTTNAALDLNAAMGRLSGRGRTVLYGVSYGTQLVLRTLAIAPPRRLDGVILDSLVPPETTEMWDLSRRSMVVDAVGRKVLAACDLRLDCRGSLGGSAISIMEAVVRDPKTRSLVGGDPTFLFGALLDFPETRARIPAILAGLRVGDVASFNESKARLEELGATFSAYPQAPLSIPLVGLISRSEGNARPALTAADLQTEAQSYLFASPLPGLLLQPGQPVYERDAAYGALPKRLPPTLVLHGDLDPKTPIEGAEAHIALFGKAGRVTLTKVEGGPHFLMLTAPSCFVPTIRHFLKTGRQAVATCAIPQVATRPFKPASAVAPSAP